MDQLPFGTVDGHENAPHDGAEIAVTLRYYDGPTEMIYRSGSRRHAARCVHMDTGGARDRRIFLTWPIPADVDLDAVTGDDTYLEVPGDGSVEVWRTEQGTIAEVAVVAAGDADATTDRLWGADT